MDSMLNRYRSITLLLVMLVGQLILLAYQVKNDNDLRLIRVWAIWAITPIAQVAETTRGAVYGVFHNYFDLHSARVENEHMHGEMSKLKIENQFLRTELNTADRVKALAAFERESPSRLLAARIIGAAISATNKIVLLDRGSNSEVEKGMAIITPDGIVGKVLEAYPTASQALLVTDPEFAAGVVSQKNHIRGILRGVGSGKCKVDNVQNEEKVDVGEEFFTSGDDRIFPRGLPVGKADVVRDGQEFKNILLYPSGLQNGPEEVLIVVQGTHQQIPAYQEPPKDEKIYMGPPPPEQKTGAAKEPVVLSTDADRLRQKYEKIGVLEGHKYGEGNVPNFNIATDQKPATAGTATVPVPLAAQHSAAPKPAKPVPPPVIAAPTAEPDAPAPPRSAPPQAAPPQ
jgi:rod shape-determining protein MreC